MYPQEAVTEINRCVGKIRVYGIKLWVARRAIDPGLNPILEKAVELDVPVLQHAWLKTTGNLPGDSFLSDVADSPNISVDQEEMLRAGWSKLLSRPWGQNG